MSNLDSLVAMMSWLYWETLSGAKKTILQRHNLIDVRNLFIPKGRNEKFSFKLYQMNKATDELYYLVRKLVIVIV